MPVKEVEFNGESLLILSSQTSQRKRYIDDAEGSKENDVHDMTPLNSWMPTLDVRPSTVNYNS